MERRIILFVSYLRNLTIFLAHSRFPPATSSGSKTGLEQRAGGRCQSHNMKMELRVREKPQPAFSAPIPKFATPRIQHPLETVKIIPRRINDPTKKKLPELVRGVKHRQWLRFPSTPSQFEEETIYLNKDSKDSVFREITKITTIDEGEEIRGFSLFAFF